MSISARHNLARLWGWIGSLPFVRRLAAYWTYRNVIQHCEMIIELQRAERLQDDAYWIGKLRQYGHILDKGLARGDFAYGHGLGVYHSAEEARRRLSTEAARMDPLVVWAAQKVCEYERRQAGEAPSGVTAYIATQCTYDDLVDAIRTRRSIRRYSDRPVDLGVVEKIVSVLDWAPTSCHRQPGAVYASTNPDIILQCLRLHPGTHCFIHMVPRPSLFMTFCADARLYSMPRQVFGPCIDVALGVQNCLLVAHSLHLSLTPLYWSHQGEREENELRRILSIPAYFQVIVSAVGGYPDGGAPVPPRKPLELHMVG